MARTSEGNLVEAARSGDNRAFGELFDRWFDRVHDLSRRIVKDPGTAGEVAQDAFLTAWTRLDTLEDPDAFGGWLLRIARNASLNRLAKERRSVALDDETMTTLTDLDAPDHDPLAHMDQAARIDLVWDAAAALGERDMSILDLHLRHGLGAPELAEELGTTANNAHQILFTLRKRLGTNVRALVLWRAGRPACDDLRRTLAAGGIATFDKQAVKVIDRHAAVCADCSQERSERLAPAALFGAAPVVAAPILLRSQAASALEAAGVPMSGSVSLGGAGGGGGTGGATGVPGPTGAQPGIAPAPAASPLPTNTPTGGGGVDDAGNHSGGDEATGDGDATDHELAAHLASGPGSAVPRSGSARSRRVLAVAAVALVLLGLALVVSGAFDDADPTDEVAAVEGPDTSGPVAPSTRPSSSSQSTATTVATTAGGELILEEVEDVEQTAPPVDPSDQPRATPTPPRPDPTVVTSTAPPTSTPSTTSTPTTTSTTTPPVLAPVIVDFTAFARGIQCRGGFLYDVAWVTENASSAILSVGGGEPTFHPTAGNTTICVARATAPTFRLVASGPGGDVAQEITGQAVIP